MLHRFDKSAILSLIACVVGFQAVGSLMGYITSQNIENWYVHLERSPFNPPNWAFGAAWTVLYLLLSLSFWMVYETKNHPHRKIVLGLFIFHMILNWAWSPLFFAIHALAASYYLILAMIFTAAMLAYLVWPISRKAALMFVPYILWLNFAGHLAEFIWRHN